MRTHSQLCVSWATLSFSRPHRHVASKQYITQSMGRRHRSARSPTLGMERLQKIDGRALLAVFCQNIWKFLPIWRSSDVTPNWTTSILFWSCSYSAISQTLVRYKQPYLHCSTKTVKCGMKNHISNVYSRWGKQCTVICCWILYSPSYKKQHNFWTMLAERLENSTSTRKQSRQVFLVW